VKHIAQIQPSTSKHRSERSELISHFVGEVKDARGRILSGREIAVLLSHVKTQSLYELISEAKSYSHQGVFWKYAAYTRAKKG